MRARHIFLTSLSGFLAVLLGALGAHALKTRLTADTFGAWQTATHYHLAHSIACLALFAWADSQPTRAKRLIRISTLWLIGCALFSGYLYLLALGGPRFLGPITPLGGLAFLAGWVLLALEAKKSHD